MLETWIVHCLKAPATQWKPNWEKLNETPYIIAGFWTLNYTRSAANARPLFALLVVVYPTYFCRILCLLGVLTGRYRTPVYFQRSSIISINENTSVRGSITRSRVLYGRRALGSYDLDENGKTGSRTRPRRKFSRELSRVHTLEIDSSSRGRSPDILTFKRFFRYFIISSFAQAELFVHRKQTESNM